jgi:hypothetical protein
VEAARADRSDCERIRGTYLVLLAYRSAAYSNVARTQLASTVVTSHPPLIVLSLVFNMVFLTLALALSLLAFTLAHPHPLLAVFVTFVSLWSLAVVRGLVRLFVSGVVAHWFFNRHEPLAPTSTDVVRTSVRRAIGPSAGTAVVAGLFLALVDLAALVLAKLRERKFLAPFFWLAAPIFALLTGYVDALNAYALVYAGVTGDDFMTSSRGAIGLVRRSGLESLVDRE